MLELTVEQEAQLFPHVTQVLAYKTNPTEQLKQFELVPPLQVKHALEQAAQLPFVRYLPLAQPVQTLAPLQAAQVLLQARHVVTELTVVE